MKFKQEVRVLHRKAVHSLSVTVGAFNSPHDEGRTTQVLLCLQHAFEMLLKAVLVQCGTNVFDAGSGRSIGFETCLHKATSTAGLRLSETDAGTLRAINALRNDEQHWHTAVSEQILYLHARAGITLFDELLHSGLGERLADHLPARVLPLSVDPPRDLALLVDEEFSQIASLLAPGRRKRHEAQARIRTLLAMEAHVEPEAHVSVRDVERVEKGIREGRHRAEVFPKLDHIGTQVDGDGLAVDVHFTKKAGAPVRFVDDDSVPAAGIRQIDLRRKFHLSPKELAERVGLTVPRGAALRRHLGIDADETCRYVFDFGSQRHPRYSDNALRRMTQAADELDLHAIWRAHGARRGGGSVPCGFDGCAERGGTMTR